MAELVVVPKSTTRTGSFISQLPDVESALVRGFPTGQQVATVRAERGPHGPRADLLGPEHLTLAGHVVQRHRSAAAGGLHDDRTEPAVGAAHRGAEAVRPAAVGVTRRAALTGRHGELLHLLAGPQVPHGGHHARVPAGRHLA